MSKVFVIKDEKVGFMGIIQDSNYEVAKFNFGKGFYREKPEFGRLEDYSLYCVGDFDLEKGLIPHPLDFVCNGLTAYKDFVSHLNYFNTAVEEVHEDENPDFEE